MGGRAPGLPGRGVAPKLACPFQRREGIAQEARSGAPALIDDSKRCPMARPRLARDRALPPPVSPPPVPKGTP